MPLRVCDTFYETFLYAITENKPRANTTEKNPASPWHFLGKISVITGISPELTQNCNRKESLSVRQESNKGMLLAHWASVHTQAEPLWLHNTTPK